ncbi:MAG: ABC transporter substrate-binding protein [Bifidobacteriaceae bacterium]|jgi:glucose/mannose transport system substrate-binding protein|nr:ABC transporter substrate-binding protein [Bifidobacteriaceae bacterium]
MRRISILVAGAAAIALTLGGCGGSDDKTTESTDAGTTAAAEDTAAAEETTESTDTGALVAGASGKLDIFTWWTAGSEALGLEELQKVLAAKYPDIEFVNGGTAAGQGGSGKEVLQTRMDAGDEPDTFQAHAGKEMQDYINADQLTDVGYLYDQFGLRNVFPEDLITMLTQDGKIYSIPSNVHRANVIWASVPVLEAAGLDATNAYYASIDDFIAALEQVKTNAPDYIPLAIGTTWCQVHLLETVLIAELGADGYNGLFDGTTDWGGAEVLSALGKFETIMSYANDDHNDMEWEPPITMIINGEAAFSIMGDWAPAAFDAAGSVAGSDYLYAPSPGTEGIFDFLADAYGVVNGAPNPTAAEAWLDVISSREGQIGFNKVKGSIPARTDIDLAAEGFSEYQISASEDFGSNAIVGSIQHGCAVTIAQGNAINLAVSKFVSGASDLETFQSELVDAMK